MKDIGRYTAWVVLILTLGFLFRGSYIMLYPFKPFVVHEIKILDNDNVVVAGDPLYYSIRYTKNMPLTARVYRRLVNSYIIPLPVTESTAAVGEGIMKSEISIPEFADAGNYSLHIIWEYTIGEHPDRTIFVSAVSPAFRVVQRPSRFTASTTRELRYLKKEYNKEIGALKQRVEQDEAIIRRHREKSSYDRAK